MAASARARDNGPFLPSPVARTHRSTGTDASSSVSDIQCAHAKDRQLPATRTWIVRTLISTPLSVRLSKEVLPCIIGPVRRPQRSQHRKRRRCVFVRVLHEICSMKVVLGLQQTCDEAQNYPSFEAATSSIRHSPCSRDSIRSSQAFPSEFPCAHARTILGHGA